MTKESKHHKEDKPFKLDSLKSKAHYQAPANYFNELSDQIMEQVGKEEAKERQFIRSVWGNWWIGPSAVAAACLVLFLLYPFMQNASSGADYLSEVSDEEIIAYLVNSDLNTDEIIEELGESTLKWQHELPNLDVSAEDTEALLEYYTL